MTTNAMEQMTAVFAIGDLSRESVAAGHQMDDTTRELPLIAGRFAGRQWIAEDLRREAEEKPERQEKSRGRIVKLSLCTAAAVMLLVGSLFGQARLTQLNDSAVAVQSQIHELRREQDALRLEYAEAEFPAAEQYAVTLGMRAPRPDQLEIVSAENADKATVLGIRKGHGLSFLWHSLLDELGAYSR